MPRKSTTQLGFRRSDGRLLFRLGLTRKKLDQRVRTWEPLTNDLREKEPTVPAAPSLTNSYWGAKM